MLSRDDSDETSQKPWIRRTAWLLLLGGCGGFLIQLCHLFGLKVLLVAVPLIISGIIVKTAIFRPRAKIVDLTRNSTTNTDT